MLKNLIAVIIGIVVGSLVNMGLVVAGPSIIPPPAGADVTTVEGMRAALPLLEAKHFIFPFLAHALGTFAGAAVAALIAATHKFTLVLIIGVFFLLGGIAASTMIPAPLWFKVVDLVFAYLPMAWLAATLLGRK